MRPGPPALVAHHPLLPGPTPCSPPFLFLCYRFEEMEHDLFAFYLKSVASPIWGSYTKTKRNPKQGLFQTRHWGDGDCLGLSKWNVCPGEGDLEGLPARAPQEGPELPPCLPPCQKMKERQAGLLNALWEPSA